jgi:Isochorismatase family
MEQSWSDPRRHSNDTIVTKIFSSVFKESSLEEILVERNGGQLYFGGLLSNTCVLATSLLHKDKIGKFTWSLMRWGGGNKKSIGDFQVRTCIPPSQSVLLTIYQVSVQNNCALSLLICLTLTLSRTDG